MEKDMSSKTLLEKVEERNTWAVPYDAFIAPAREDDDSECEPALADANPRHREDFNALLGAVVRKRKPNR